MTDLRNGEPGADVPRFFKQTDTVRVLGTNLVLDKLTRRFHTGNGWRTTSVASGTFISFPPKVPA
jgi:hypothetical protein